MNEPVVWLHGRDELRARVGDRTVRIPGERLFPPHSGFWAEDSSAWRWDDGGPLTQAERLTVEGMLPEAALAAGIELELDEMTGTRSALAGVGRPMEGSIKFVKFNHLWFEHSSGTAIIPGDLRFDGGKPHFRIDAESPWKWADDGVIDDDQRPSILAGLQRVAATAGVVLEPDQL